MEAAIKDILPHHPTTLENLSDDFLINIFQHLLTPEAVQACCSLKKWKVLWAKVPILSFDITDAYEDTYPGVRSSVIRESFADQIAVAFLKRDAIAMATLLEFRLVFDFADFGERNDEVRSWVRSAVARGAKKIDLRFTKLPLRRTSRGLVPIRCRAIDRPTDFSFHFSDIQNEKVAEFGLDKIYKSSCLQMK